MCYATLFIKMHKLTSSLSGNCKLLSYFKSQKCFPALHQCYKRHYKRHLCERLHRHQFLLLADQLNCSSSFRQYGPDVRYVVVPEHPQSPVWCGHAHQVQPRGEENCNAHWRCWITGVYVLIPRQENIFPDTKQKLSNSYLQIRMYFLFRICVLNLSSTSTWSTSTKVHFNQSRVSVFHCRC